MLGSQTNLELWSRIQSSRSRFALPPISTLNDEKSSIQLGPTAEASATGGTAGRRGEGAERKTFEELERGMRLAGNVFLPGAVSDELLIFLLLRELRRFCAPQREGRLRHRFS